MPDGLILSSFADNMVELWSNLFQGNERFKFYLGFCIVTFGVPFILIWAHGVATTLYFYLVLGKKYPEEWKWLVDTGRKRGNLKLYKKWIGDKGNCDNPFWRIYRGRETFGKTCLALWFAVILVVGIAVLIKKYW